MPSGTRAIAAVTANSSVKMAPSRKDDVTVPEGKRAQIPRDLMPRGWLDTRVPGLVPHGSNIVPVAIKIQRRLAKTACETPINGASPTDARQTIGIIKVL